MREGPLGSVFRSEVACRSTPEDVQKLRESGWSEDQISLAVYIISIFAFSTALQTPFGLPSQNYLGMEEQHADDADVYNCGEKISWLTFKYRKAAGILGPMAISPESARVLRELAEVLLRGPNTLDSS